MDKNCYISVRNNWSLEWIAIEETQKLFGNPQNKITRNVCSKGNDHFLHCKSISSRIWPLSANKVISQNNNSRWWPKLILNAVRFSALKLSLSAPRVNFKWKFSSIIATKTFSEKKKSYLYFTLIILKIDE